MSAYLADPVLESTIRQLRFLLNQAPMIEVPEEVQEWRKRVSSPFVYIHPKTFDRFTIPEPWKEDAVVRFPKSPTKWVLTSLMPEGRVIFSPNLMPGTIL